MTQSRARSWNPPWREVRERGSGLRPDGGPLRVGMGNAAGTLEPAGWGRRAGSKLLGFFELTLEFLPAFPNNHNNKAGSTGF